MSKESFVVGVGSDGNGTGAGKTSPWDQQNSVLVPPGLVSLVIPCSGQLEYTKLCVPSVLRHSRPPFELIFIDIGSLDGTADYLAGLTDGLQSREDSWLRVEVVRATTDLDIKDAVSEALRLARGEYVVLLNNDTVVTPHWLDMMITLAAISPAIGLVGPMSNYAAPPQLVETVPYRLGPKKGAGREGRSQPLVDVAAVTRFAKEFQEKNRGKWDEVPHLGGFCLLVKRIVLMKIRDTISLREWTDLGMFDTEVLSLKAKKLGFTLARCKDLFIHHFGSRIFAHGAPKAEAEPAAV